MLTQWSPFSQLFEWHKDNDDLFNQFFRVSADAGRQTIETWLPAVEGYAKDEQYVLRVDLPGVDPKDVEISVVNNQLNIRGERKSAHAGENLKYHHAELSYGSFHRTLALPSAIDTDKINARYENGVLEITFPLPSSLTVKRIPVRIEAPRQVKAA
jgi:HSP20 family protein